MLFLGATSPAESTELLTAIIAQTTPYRVLRCGASETRSGRPYHALADLLSTITDGDLAPLPEPQRAVLSGAPFRASPPADYFTPAAVRVAVLNLCRRLARTGPLLLVLDEVNQLDAASTDVLSFLARAGAGLPIWTLAAEHLTGTARSIGHRLCLRPLLVLGLGALSPADMTHLIDALTAATKPPDARP